MEEHDLGLLEAPAGNLDAIVRQNFFEGDRNIEHVGHGKFHNFLSGNGLVMVMFYNPRFGACTAVRDQFTIAASITDRPDTAYAAVNCGTDRDLCLKEGVMELPQFRAYHNGNYVGSYENTYTITGADLAKFMNELPTPLHSSSPNPRRRFY
ncbi:hypothetical protein BsWGS_17001 [Bradybaena similaris]